RSIQEEESRNDKKVCVFSFNRNPRNKTKHGKEKDTARNTGCQLCFQYLVVAIILVFCPMRKVAFLIHFQPFFAKIAIAHAKQRVFFYQVKIVGPNSQAKFCSRKLFCIV